MGGRRLGNVLTIRDQTELRSLMGELDSVRSFAESLRSQAHESANRLHTVITMVELGRPEEQSNSRRPIWNSRRPSSIV